MDGILEKMKVAMDEPITFWFFLGVVAVITLMFVFKRIKRRKAEQCQTKQDAMLKDEQAIEILKQTISIMDATINLFSQLKSHNYHPNVRGFYEDSWEKSKRLTKALKDFSPQLDFKDLTWTEDLKPFFEEIKEWALSVAITSSQDYKSDDFKEERSSLYEKTIDLSGEIRDFFESISYEHETPEPDENLHTPPGEKHEETEAPTEQGQETASSRQTETEPEDRRGEDMSTDNQNKEAGKSSSTKDPLKDFLNEYDAILKNIASIVVLAVAFIGTTMLISGVISWIKMESFSITSIPLYWLAIVLIFTYILLKWVANKMAWDPVEKIFYYDVIVVVTAVIVFSFAPTFEDSIFHKWFNTSATAQATQTVKEYGSGAHNISVSTGGISKWMRTPLDSEYYLTSGNNDFTIQLASGKFISSKDKKNWPKPGEVFRLSAPTTRQEILLTIS